MQLNFTTHCHNNFYDIKKNADLNYDMVLTDIQMPNINGFEVLEKLRDGTYSHYIGQPVIAMTGRKDLEKETYLESGFADILQKPFTKDLFIMVLTKIFPAQVTKGGEMDDKQVIASSSNLFSLEVISSFLGDDRDGIAEVLHTFITDTTKSMDRLKEAIDSGTIKDINSISHKMLPMFRQLRAKEGIPILERLETLGLPDINTKELRQDYRELKNNVTVLILAIKSYLAKDLNYSG